MSADDNPAEGSDSSPRSDTDAQNTTNNDDESGSSYKDDVKFGDEATDGEIGSGISPDDDSRSLDDAIEEAKENIPDEDGDDSDDVGEEDDAEPEEEDRESGSSEDDESEVEMDAEEIRAAIDALVDEFGASIPRGRAPAMLSEDLDCSLSEAKDMVLDHADIDSEGMVTGSASGFAHIANRDDPSEDEPLPWSQIQWLYKATPADFPEGVNDKQSDVNADAREELAVKLDAEHHWMFLVDDEQGIEEFRVYEPDSGIYEKGAKRKLKRIMKRKIGGKATKPEVGEVADWLKAFNETTLDEIEGGDEPLRCFENGVLNYETWDFTPEHSPEHLFVRTVNARWDGSVDTSIVKEFLADITEREADAKVIEEMFGDTLVGHYDRQWFGILYGGGANAKSVLTSALRQVLGSENVTGESLHDIAETRWSSERLVGGAGAFANIDAEVPESKITDAAAIKNNTGGDSTAHERKGEDKFDAVNTAKMIFGANEPPVFKETKRSIKRRIKPIELPYTYLPEDEVDENDPYQKSRDTDMEDKLTTDEARAAWVQVMAEGLQRLQDNGEFSFPETQDELFDRYQKASDPIQVFLREMVRSEPSNWTDSDTPVYMTFQELYNMYTNMCNDMNETPATSKTFGRELKKQSIVAMEPYYPAEIDSQHAKRYVVPTQDGWDYVGTSVKERFAMRAPATVDAPSPGAVANGGSSDDGSDSGESGVENLFAKVTSAITQLGNANGTGAKYAMILDRVEEDVDEVADLDAVLMKGIRKGKVEMTDDDRYRVVSDGDSDD
jgi:P4 family phage/plasmid primase-like protien